MVYGKVMSLYWNKSNVHPAPLSPLPPPIFLLSASFNKTASLEFEWDFSLGQWAWHVYSWETSTAVITAGLTFKTQGLRGNVRLWMSTLCVSLFIYLSIYNFVHQVRICVVWHIALIIRGKRGKDMEKAQCQNKIFRRTKHRSRILVFHTRGPIFAQAYRCSVFALGHQYFLLDVMRKPRVTPLIHKWGV